MNIYKSCLEKVEAYNRDDNPDKKSGMSKFDEMCSSCQNPLIRNLRIDDILCEKSYKISAMKVEYGIYSASKQGYLTRETGIHQWSVWAVNAQTFETLEGATKFLELSGYENTTDCMRNNGAYVVTLTVESASKNVSQSV